MNNATMNQRMYNTTAPMEAKKNGCVRCELADLQLAVKELREEFLRLVQDFQPVVSTMPCDPPSEKIGPDVTKPALAAELQDIRNSVNSILKDMRVLREHCEL